MDFSHPTVTQALFLLPVLLPIALWVTWSDLKFMKIPNTAVLATFAAWVVLGWPAVGMEGWLWGFAILGITLVCTFIGNLAGLFGAGDAKFAAAIAPVFVFGDWMVILTLYVVCSIAALLAHRVMRSIPAVRQATPDWKSWTSNKFPFGMALSAMVVFYLLAAFLPKG